MRPAPTKLRFGTYRTPRFKLGQKIVCAARGEVTIVAISDGPFPWPIGARRGSDRSLVLTGDLVKAVRQEASIAVRHWWGVGNWAVWVWRKALGVKRTAGDIALRSEYSSRPGHRAMIGAVGRRFARDPERRRKIGDAKRGKARPAKVVEAMRRRMLGNKLSAKTRRRMSVAQKKRGAWPPAAGVAWSKAEEKLLRTLPVAEIARRTGRTAVAVRARRQKLGLPDGRTRAERRKVGRSR